MFVQLYSNVQDAILDYSTLVSIIVNGWERSIIDKLGIFFIPDDIKQLIVKFVTHNLLTIHALFVESSYPISKFDSKRKPLSRGVTLNLSQDGYLSQDCQGFGFDSSGHNTDDLNIDGNHITHSLINGSDCAIIAYGEETWYCDAFAIGSPPPGTGWFTGNYRHYSIYPERKLINNWYPSCPLILSGSQDQMMNHFSMKFPHTILQIIAEKLIVYRNEIHSKLTLSMQLFAISKKNHILDCCVDPKVSNNYWNRDSFHYHLDKKQLEDDGLVPNGYVSDIDEVPWIEFESLSQFNANLKQMISVVKFWQYLESNFASTTVCRLKIENDVLNTCSMLTVVSFASTNIDRICQNSCSKSTSYAYTYNNILFDRFINARIMYTQMAKEKGNDKNTKDTSGKFDAILDLYHEMKTSVLGKVIYNLLFGDCQTAFVCVCGIDKDQITKHKDKSHTIVTSQLGERDLQFVNSIKTTFHA